MSREYNVKQVRSGKVAANGVASAKSQIAHPVNCRTECPYGYGRSFCFPCMAKIMKEHSEQKRG